MGKRWWGDVFDVLDGDGMGVAIFDECKNQVKISGNVFIALMNAKIRGKLVGMVFIASMNAKIQ